MHRPTELESLLELLLSGGTHSPRSKSLARALVRGLVPAGIPESESFQAFFSRMTEAETTFLRETPGMNEPMRLKLQAAFRLAEKYLLFRNRLRQSPMPELVPTPPRMTELAMARVPEEFRQLPHEWVGFIPLYRDGTLGHLCVTEEGGRSEVRFDAAEFFSRVLALRPSGVYLFHHHPSGDLRPSRADYELTQQVSELCRFFRVRLLDHGIVSPLGEVWISEVRSPAHEPVLPPVRETRKPVRLRSRPASEQPGSRVAPPAPAGTG